MHRNLIYRMLRNPYYIGYVTYKGELYKGRHEPLIDHETFTEVQKLIESRGKAKERRRIHHHYLKGSVFCGECYQRDGTIQVMVLQPAKNRHGNEYLYLYCPLSKARAGRICSGKHSNVIRVEDAITEHYALMQLEDEFIDALGHKLRETVEQDENHGIQRKKLIRKQLEELEQQEIRLVDLATTGAVASQHVRTKMISIQSQREQLKSDLETVQASLTDIEHFIRVAMEFLRDIQDLYMHAQDEVRRRLNQAIFTRIFIREDEVVDVEIAEPFNDLLAAQSAYNSWRGTQAKTQHQDNRPQPKINLQHETEEGASNRGGSLFIQLFSANSPANADLLVRACSDTNHLVREAGLEPARQRHWNLNPARLPIPPLAPRVPPPPAATAPQSTRAQAPSFSRSRPTCPVALTLYWASSTRPCSSTTTVERISPS